MHTKNTIHEDRRQQTIERFWSKVQMSGPDDCWNWIGGMCKDGYGKFADKGRTLGLGRSLRSHRVSYFLAHGQLPKGILICHTCDNPACVNPRHLWAGSVTDNNRDMIRKGRRNIRRGESPRRSRLTEAQVREILAVYRPRHPEFGGIALAKKYGVHKATISAIVKRKTWAHL